MLEGLLRLGMMCEQVPPVSLIPSVTLLLHLVLKNQSWNMHWKDCAVLRATVIHEDHKTDCITRRYVGFGWRHTYAVETFQLQGIFEGNENKVLFKYYNTDMHIIFTSSVILQCLFKYKYLRQCLGRWGLHMTKPYSLLAWQWKDMHTDRTSCLALEWKLHYKYSSVNIGCAFYKLVSG